MNPDSIELFEKITSSQSFDDLTFYREEAVDDVMPSEKGWLWPKEDTGAWGGVKEQYVDFYKERYRKYGKNMEVIVQAGGACGLYPRLMSDLFRFVYTFEPFPVSFHCLTYNCQKPNIFKFNAALGSSCGTVMPSHFYEGNVGMNKVNVHNGGGAIPMIAIDSLNLSACDFIQLDIEGDEQEALYGALNTIKKFKPGISLETSPDSFMESLGYQRAEHVGSDTFWEFRG